MENKFKEFWICGLWDSKRVTLDENPIFTDNYTQVFHVIEYAALESANTELINQGYEHNKKVTELELQLKSANAEIAKLTKALKNAGECGHGRLAQDNEELKAKNAKLHTDLIYYQEMEDRYNQLLEETSAENIEKYKQALNRIGILAMSEHAYTSEFTERTKAIIQEVLK